MALTTLTRRNVLNRAAAAALGICSPHLVLDLFQNALAASVQADPTSYRALVCIFLSGGNDGYNLLAPSDSSRYKVYAASRSNLAIAKGDLLPLDGKTEEGTYGLHPRTTGLAQLYNAGQLAFVANMGTLLQPTTKEEYEEGRMLPSQLFSHSDQSDQWMASRLDTLSRSGWGGRLADLLSRMNGTARLPLGISVAGNNLFQVGEAKYPYIMSPYGAQGFSIVPQDSTDQRGKAFKALLDLASLKGRPMQREYADSVKSSVDLCESVMDALEAGNVGTGGWPNTDLGWQLQMITRMISVRSMLGMTRQVFYAMHGGYDTHADQLYQHGSLLADLSASLAAFQAALSEIGAAGEVTTFTMSEFGRTLTSNYDGTDHAWGNVQLVTGASVAGGKVYGTFPDLTVGGPDDCGYGRLIPTTAVEQYGATLAHWFGVSEANLAVVFPHLSRFSTSDLGFMA